MHPLFASASLARARAFARARTGSPARRRRVFRRPPRARSSCARARLGRGGRARDATSSRGRGVGHIDESRPVACGGTHGVARPSAPPRAMGSARRVGRVRGRARRRYGARSNPHRARGRRAKASRGRARGGRSVRRRARRLGGGGEVEVERARGRTARRGAVEDDPDARVKGARADGGSGRSSGRRARWEDVDGRARGFRATRRRDAE